jgi:hypothetical protein
MALQELVGKDHPSEAVTTVLLRMSNFANPGFISAMILS